MTRQQPLNFSPPLTVQFPKLRDLLVHVVYGCRQNLGGVAAALDHSPSELSRMLNREQDDPRKLDVDDLVRIIEVTGDLRPIQWLDEKFKRNPEQVRADAVAQLAQWMPMMAALVEQAVVPKARK